MFSNLIESGSHRRDLARRGRFFLGTLALYGALLALAGVASIYAFNARLGEQTYTITLLPPYTPPAEAPPDAPRPAEPASGGDRSELPQRAAAILDLNTVTSEPPPISTTPTKSKPLVPGAIVTGRDVDVGGVGVGPASPGPVAGAHDNVAVRVPIAEVDDPPPPKAAPPTPSPTPPDKIRVTTQILSSKAISKPAPPYPPLAITTRTEGTVAVEILIDEEGKVISATATSGPPMLRAAAQNAALQARFTPTFLNGRPVKVSGVITYNFKLQ